MHQAYRARACLPGQARQSTHQPVRRAPFTTIAPEATSACGCPQTSPPAVPSLKGHLVGGGEDVNLRGSEGGGSFVHKTPTDLSTHPKICPDRLATRCPIMTGQTSKGATEPQSDRRQHRLPELRLPRKSFRPSAGDGLFGNTRRPLQTASIRKATGAPTRTPVAANRPKAWSISSRVALWVTIKTGAFTP